jgi:uncharacterized protein YrrD
VNDQRVAWILVEPGWKVEASDGKEVGTVHEVLADEEKDIFDGLSVSSGLLKRPRYVPAESVREITEGRIALTISEDAFHRLTELSEQ